MLVLLDVNRIVNDGGRLVVGLSMLEVHSFRDLAQKLAMVVLLDGDALDEGCRLVNSLSFLELVIFGDFTENTSTIIGHSCRTVRASYSS